MGSTETNKSAQDGKETKEPKPSVDQEQNSVTSGTVTAEWGAFQGYSPMPPHAFLTPNPQAHPYMWGVQQFMPPFSTPPHPYVMYPTGGIYAHPTIPPGSYPFSSFAMPSPNGIAEASPNTPGNLEVDGKSSERKEKLPIKVSKGSLARLNMVTGKDIEPGKTSGASANGVHSKSGESASEGRSEGSDANSRDDSQMKSGGLQDSAETSQNGSAGPGSRNGGPHTPQSKANQAHAIVPMAAAGPVSGVPPTTNLNIGMDYWSAATPSTIPAMHGKVPSLGAGGMVTNGSRENLQSQPWIQDERELKRQRRKQSNRESARRSRLRKQAECDELAHCAAALKEENMSLRAEVARIRSEYEQLRAQNASLKEKLGETSSEDDPRCGQESEEADKEQSAE